MNILIIDDHALFAEGIRLLLLDASNLEADVTIASSYTNAEEIIKQQHFDLILVDLFMPHLDGFDAIRLIREASPRSFCVTISSSDNPIDVQKVLENGASGFISKTAKPKEMIAAIMQICKGEIYIPSEIKPYLNVTSYIQFSIPSNSISEDNNTFEVLTPRQLEVLRWVALGEPNKSIAQYLSCSEATIKAHIGVILKSLGAKNRTEAARMATQLELLPEDSGLRASLNDELSHSHI